MNLLAGEGLDSCATCVGAGLKQVRDVADQVELTYEVGGVSEKLVVDGLLVTTGRTPNTKELVLENTSLNVGPRGSVPVNEKLETNVPGVWALGDVNGGPQFTYISLDDYRIVNNQLFGNQTRTLTNLPIYPNTTFLHPAVATIGLSAKAAKEQNLAVDVVSVLTKTAPKSNVIGDPRGIFQAVVDKKTKLILGATIYAEESYEIINLISLAMNQQIPATALRDQIYYHPTMAETFNDLFAGI